MKQVINEVEQSSHEDVLEHYGIKGMKWGIRRKGRGVKVEAKPKEYSEDATKVNQIKAKRKEKGTQALSNKEMREAIERMNLEQQLNRLSPQIEAQGKKAVGAAVARFGQQASNQLVDTAAKAVAAAMLESVGVTPKKGG